MGYATQYIYAGNPEHGPIADLLDPGLAVDLLVTQDGLNARKRRE